MRTASFCLSLLGLALIRSSGKGAEELKFEEVVVEKSVHPGHDLLYVVLTEPKANGEKLDDLVLKYAETALQAATVHQFKGTTKMGELYKYDGTIVFLVRAAKGNREGAAAGFSVEQLEQILAATPERARTLVQRQSWGPGKLPGKK